MIPCTWAFVLSCQNLKMSIHINRKIGVLFEAGHSGPEIFKLLKNQGMPRATVFPVIKRLKKGEPLDGKIRNRQMPSVVTAKLTKLLRSRLDRNAHQRGRKIPRELGVSHNSIQKCLQKFLQRKAFKCGRVVALFDPTRKHQYKKCLALKRVLADGNSRRALYVDETPVPYGVAVLRPKRASLGEG
jgi:hypothetical protein